MDTTKRLTKRAGQPYANRPGSMFFYLRFWVGLLVFWVCLWVVCLRLLGLFLVLVFLVGFFLGDSVAHAGGVGLMMPLNSYRVPRAFGVRVLVM